MVNFFAMQLQAVDTVDTISPEDFKKNYYNTMKPVVIKSLSKQWPAHKKWTWDYFIDIVGDKELADVTTSKSTPRDLKCLRPHRIFSASVPRSFSKFFVPLVSRTR